MVDVELPVTPLRRQVLFTEPISDMSSHLPMTIDFASSFYFHREGPGVLLGMSDPEEKPGFVTETSDDWIPRLIEIASVLDRLPQPETPEAAARQVEANLAAGADATKLFIVTPQGRGQVKTMPIENEFEIQRKIVRSKLPTLT